MLEKSTSGLLQILHFDWLSYHGLLVIALEIGLQKEVCVAIPVSSI